MNIWQKMRSLIGEKTVYDDDSQQILSEFPRSAKNLQAIDAMKRTEGWQMLEKILREKVHSLIMDKVKDDTKIQSLLDLMNLTDTKTQWQQLDEEVTRLLPPE